MPFNRKEYSHQWYLENRQRVMEKSRARYLVIRGTEEYRATYRKYGARWRKENPEKTRANYKKWADANHEMLLIRWRADKEGNAAKASRWRARNPGHAAKWRARNVERSRQTVRNYRARRRAAAGSCSTERWLSRVKYYGWRCFYCTATLNNSTLTQDHRIPLARGGSNWPANLVPCCKSCNSAKCDRKGPPNTR